MGARELLNDFVFFLPSGRLLELHCDPSGLDATALDLSHSVSGECQMGEVPTKGTPMLKSSKRIFGTRGYTVIMTYLVFGICAIYIILMNLHYWA